MYRLKAANRILFTGGNRCSMLSELERFSRPIVPPPSHEAVGQFFPILTNPSFPPPTPADSSNRKIMTYNHFPNRKIRTYINFPNLKISTYNSQNPPGPPKNAFFYTCFTYVLLYFYICFTHVLHHFLHLLLYFLQHLPTQPNR